MARRRAKVIPKNVLAQETLRRKYVEEPWPRKLILVKSTLGKDSDIRVRGSVTRLFYSLSYPYLYVDERDLEELGDMVTEAKDAKAIRGDQKSVTRHDAPSDAERAKATGKRKRGRPRKSSRGLSNDSSNNGKIRGVSARDNDG